MHRKVVNLRIAMNVTSSSKKYYMVYSILVVLTLLTCALSLVPQVGWHATIGLGIASVKAGLIAVFFMHILSSDRLPWLALLAGILWFLLLLGLTLADYLMRAGLSY
jgi:cytochrome c oxidase subunit 4